MPAREDEISRSGEMGRLPVMESKPPFDQVVRDHGATVLRICRAVAGFDDADDVWSETFLAAMKAYPDLPAAANREAWLVTIAHRRSIDAIRTRRRRPIPVEPADGPQGADEPSFGDGFDTRLAEALSALPDKQRISVAYHYLVGLPYKEVAKITGGTTDAARRAAADGIRRLRSITPALLDSEEDQ